MPDPPIPPCVVIGASAGGLDALIAIVAGLPADFPALIAIVWHIPAHRPSQLPAILQRHSALPVRQAVDCDPLQPGQILVAPADHHLLLAPGHLRVVQGPKENGFRPAVDPLFRSAALVCGAQAMGVVLSGAMDDGTAGLMAIAMQGGHTIVQDPADAPFPSMPASALRHVPTATVRPATAIAPVLRKLIRQLPPQKGPPLMDEPQRLTIEDRIAAGEHAVTAGVLTLGVPSLHTCPECHGGLLQIMEGTRVRFRCYTGHAYSLDALLAAIATSMDADLEQTFRGLEEAAMLLREEAQRLRAQAQGETAAQYAVQAQIIEARANAIRAAVLAHPLGTLPGMADHAGDGTPSA
jgi:two-component system, chemotaxis family, protein-glutamate methylesterase/glutaminase